MLALLLAVPTAAAAQDAVPRAYYGARLEPRDKIVTGAGQDRDGWESFAREMAPGRLPLIYMGYVSLRANPGRRVERIGKQMREVESQFPGLKLVPQIGLSMTSDGKPEERYEHLVAAGEFDAQIAELAEALRALGRPVYLRIGYEFNGRWNGYQPETYKQAFIRVTKALRAAGVWHATVWCASSPEVYWQFYPGDEWVDWWGADLFAPHQVEKATVGQFMDAAHGRCKPVLIGESTARARKDPETGTFTNLNQDWDSYFGPYFKMLKARKELKAFGYINWDWSRTHAWKTWGDAQIQTNPEMARRWREEMRNPIFLTQTYDEAHFPREPSRSDCVPEPLPAAARAPSGELPVDNSAAPDSMSGSDGAAPLTVTPAPPAPAAPPRQGCGGCTVSDAGGSALVWWLVPAILWWRRRRA